MSTQLFDIPLKTLQGKPATLKDYSGKVMLVVNVASKCGLTPQYEALEKVYEQYQARGFTVLGFPVNDFAGQEPGTAQEIEQFCQTNFAVKFPLFEKISVKEPHRHPLYKALINAQPEAISPAGNAFEERLIKFGSTRAQKSDILWNFEKFLIDRKGQVVARFNPDVKPDDEVVVKAIQAALG